MTEDPKPDPVSLREIEKVLVGHDGSLSDGIRALLAVAKAALAQENKSHELHVACERIRK